MGAHTAPRTCTTGRLVGRSALTVAAAVALTGGTASFAFAGVSAQDAHDDCSSTCGDHERDRESHDSEDENCDDHEHDGRDAKWDHDEDDRDHHGEWDRDRDERDHKHDTFKKVYKEGFKDGFEVGYDKGSERTAAASGLLTGIL